MSFWFSLVCLQFHCWSHFTRPQKGGGKVDRSRPCVQHEENTQQCGWEQPEGNVFFPILLMIWSTLEVSVVGISPAREFSLWLNLSYYTWTPSCVCLLSMSAPLLCKHAFKEYWGLRRQVVEWHTRRHTTGTHASIFLSVLSAPVDPSLNSVLQINFTVS